MKEKNFLPVNAAEIKALGWDYLTLLYRNPTQVLPVLCLVSPENHTGKSSFGNALSYLFGTNVGFYTQDDLNSTFNGWIKSLVAVFEEISDAKKTLNKIKAMSTAKKATINENEVTINDLSEDIKKKVQMLNSKKNDIDSYYETEICKKILADIKYKNANKIKKIPLKKLKSKEIIALKFAAKSNLNGLFNRIASDYRKFDNEDIICICLLLLDASTTDISELMGKSYNAVWTRNAKIKGIFNIDSSSNLHSYLLTLV